MKFKIIIITAIIVFSNLGTGNAQEDKNASAKDGIEFFEGTWKEALELADKENKAIFLDVFASWCGPCKMLKANTFPNADAGLYFNKNFINVTLDGEKGEGVQIAREFNVRAYPSLFIVNSSGEAVLYYPGYIDAEQLIELGKAGIKRLDEI